MLEKEISIVLNHKQTILCHTNDFGVDSVYIMSELTEEEENYIDSDDCNKVVRNGKNISKDKIKMYGDINLSNEDDLDLIEKYNLVDENFRSFIYSNFNYNRGTITTIDGKLKWYPTMDAINWFKFNHCIIGKPKKIIVYKLPKALL